MRSDTGLTLLLRLVGLSGLTDMRLDTGLTLRLRLLADFALSVARLTPLLLPSDDYGLPFCRSREVRRVLVMRVSGNGCMLVFGLLARASNRSHIHPSNFWPREAERPPCACPNLGVFVSHSSGEGIIVG